MSVEFFARFLAIGRSGSVVDGSIASVGLIGRSRATAGPLRSLPRRDIVTCTQWRDGMMTRGSILSLLQISAPLLLAASLIVSCAQPRHASSGAAAVQGPTAASDQAPLAATPGASSREARFRSGARVGTRYSASLADGERELQQMARTARIETAWVFIPSISTWIAVGSDKHAHSVTARMEPVAAWLAAQQKRAGATIPRQLVLYHIHAVRTLNQQGVYPPDSGDIYALATLKHLFAVRYGVDLTGAELDGTGIWRFDVTPALLDSLSLPPFPKSNIVWPPDTPPRSGEPGPTLMIDRRLEFYHDFDTKTFPLLVDARRPRSERISDFLNAARELQVAVSYSSGTNG